MAEDIYSKSISELLRKKDQFILGSEADFLKDFSGIEEAIFKAVRKKASSLSQSEGKILFDEGNTAAVNEMNQIIRGAIQGSQYPEKVGSYLRSMDQIKRFNFDAHERVNDLSPDELEKLINPIQKEITKLTLDGLTGSGINSNFSDPLREGIYKNIVAGTTFSDLEAYLKGFILSDEQRLGQFKRYVSQISRDTLNQFDGQINGRIAEEYGLNAFRYVGSIIEDSRPQCVQWVAMRTLLKEDLPALIASATASGSGMIPGTNAENFAVYRGGYNCRHSAVPFKMTKSQKEDYDQMKKDQEKEKAKGAKESEKKIDQQIKEVKKEAKPKKEPKPKPEGELKKNPLNPDQFLSTRDPEMNRKMMDVMTKANLLNDVLNKDKTWVALRTPTESTQLAARKFIERNGKSGKVPSYELGTLGKNTNGFVSRYDGQWRNIAFQIKIEPGSVIDFEGFNFEINDSVIESVLKKNPGWKITNSGNLGKPLSDGRFQIMAEKIGGKWKWEGLTEAAEAIQVKKNIAPVITHESGHALHNSYDPGFIKAKELMKKYRFTLMDSPSIYGQTNQAEFIVETFTAYVYDNAGFKKNFPNQFAWIEEWMDTVGIDKKTVTLAK